MANSLGAALGVGLRVEASCILLDKQVFKISSEESPRKGLKSSSAVSSAVALACLKEASGKADLLEAARYSAEASIQAGVSVTGAFDDASACVLGGLTVTNNLERKLVARRPVDASLRVLILVPPGGMLSGKVDTSLFKPVEPLMRLAHRLALEGEEWLAMTLNGLAVSTALGLDEKPALEALKAGAVAAGVSGKGPAVAAVVKPGEAEEVRRALSRFGRIVETGVCNENASVE
jgi:shikimate kinase